MATKKQEPEDLPEKPPQTDTLDAREARFRRRFEYLRQQGVSADKAAGIASMQSYDEYHDAG